MPTQNPPTTLAGRLADVVNETSDENIRSCAQELVRQTDLPAVEYPKKSFAATIRHHQPDGLPEVTRRRLIDMAVQLADEAREQPDEVGSRTSRKGEWLTAREAAEILQIRRRLLVERLHHWEERKRYGWPWWDGHRWNFCSLALEPVSRASHLSSLPEAEPQPELLPPWCERQPTQGDLQQQSPESDDG